MRKGLRRLAPLVAARLAGSSGERWERVKWKVDETRASVAETYEGAPSGG